MISKTTSTLDSRPLIRHVLNNRFLMAFVVISAVAIVTAQSLTSLKSDDVPDDFIEFVNLIAFLIPACLFLVILVCWSVARKVRLKQYKCNVCRYHWQQAEDRPDLIESRIELVEIELKSARRQSNRKRLVGLLFSLGYLVSVGQDDWARGQALCEEALPLAEADGDLKNLAYVLDNLGFVLTFRGEWARAVPLLERAVTLFRQIEEWNILAVSLGDLGQARLFLGQHEAASRNFEECLGLMQKMGETGWEVIRNFEGMAGVAVGLAQPTRAATLAGAAKIWHERSGIVQGLTPYRYFQQTVNRLRADLDSVSLETAWQEGAKMTPLEVYQYAVAILEPVG